MRREDAEEWTQAQGQVLAGSWRMIHLAVKLGVPAALGISTDRWVQDRLGGYVRLSIMERKDAHRELASEGLSQREIAQRTGVGQRTVGRDLESDDSAQLPDVQDVQTSEPNASPGRSTDERVPDPEPARVSGPPDIRHCACSELQVEPGTADLIFTDPPYHIASLANWADLGHFASQALKPGALLLSYTGQLKLPVVLETLGEYLEYWWTGAVIHNGAFFQMHDRRLNVGWKPVVMFRKEGDSRPPWAKDIVLDGKSEKSGHAWQQAEAEAAYWIDKLTRPGDLVIDPFLGSGTTARVCNRLDRRFIGCDIDLSAYETACREQG